MAELLSLSTELGRLREEEKIDSQVNSLSHTFIGGHQYGGREAVCPGKVHIGQDKEDSM